ncbi:uncharacterized protein FRV6_12022 [Fusarium oxysporum]|uniref:Uncharacterized protein n=1 Tax=Fusarium oxysporum TaxID=5507 RepID=A0A2H3TJQ1_FUSOX|nr:uncharacterized protein FRV6_12022 [Fusarium oxysporum]
MANMTGLPKDDSLTKATFVRPSDILAPLVVADPIRTSLQSRFLSVLLQPFTFLNRAAFANAIGTVQFVTRTATDEMQPHLVVRPCPTATDLAAITKRTAHGSASEGE